MNRLYYITALIYGIVLILFIPLSIVAQILVGAAGHVHSFQFTDYLVFGYALATAFLLFRSGREIRNGIAIPTPSFYTLTSLLIIGILGAFYSVLETFFEDQSASDIDGTSVGIVAVFAAVNLLLLKGLWTNRPTS